MTIDQFVQDLQPKLISRQADRQTLNLFNKIFLAKKKKIYENRSICSKIIDEHIDIYRRII